jgi:hypothetical protein
MHHRHVTLEDYELALEHSADAAFLVAQEAAKCRRCQAELQAAPLDVLNEWRVPSIVGKPVDWESALRRAIAPSSQLASRRRLRRLGRAVAALSATASFAAAACLVAAATALPSSPLYTVRALEESSRVALAPGPARAQLEASYATSYVWDARLSASRNDSESYRVSMTRALYWAGRLSGDIGNSSPSDRAAIRARVEVAKTMVANLRSSGQDRSGEATAEAVLSDVEDQADEQDGRRARQTEGGSRGGARSPAASGRSPASTPSSDSSEKDGQRDSREGNGDRP